MNITDNLGKSSFRGDAGGNVDIIIINIHARRLSLQEVGRLPQVSIEDQGLSLSDHSPAQLPDPRPLPLFPPILFFFNEQAL